jgi:hypothetical protein
MLANPYGVTTPSSAAVTKIASRSAAENDNADTQAKSPDRVSGRAPEPHWDAVIAAATD